jgi:hypothetical protein
VDGRVIESDGKPENAQHVLALDPFTLAALKAHVKRLDQERRELGPEYQDHGVLFCWEDGPPPHPDTITRRFKAGRSRSLAVTRTIIAAPSPGLIPTLLRSRRPGVSAERRMAAMARACPHWQLT